MHLQQTEGHDWVGEVTHCCSQVCYLLLQNYNISRFNFYNYNFHLIVLTTLFFAQRVWFFLWRLTQLSDAHGRRFTCHIVLFFVLLDALYCVGQLMLKESLGAVYLAIPVLGSVLFYHVYLKTKRNAFTAELFSMLSRCLYHSLETAYCIGVLPLQFLQYEHIYYDTSRCMALTAFVTAYTFLMLFSLELHSLGSEVLQQTRMLGEWRWIRDPQRLKAISQNSGEWSCHNCPYPRGAIVTCKGRYYEAMATLNTCSPSCPSMCIYPIAFILGDPQRTKTMFLSVLLSLNAALLYLILWSNQWSMYAVMMIPSCGHFLYMTHRRSHLFFNPAHLSLREMHWDGISEVQQQSCQMSCCDPLARSWGGCAEELGEEDEDSAETSSGNSHPSDVVNSGFFGACSQCPNPLFMSAVSASTMLFFDPSGTARCPPENTACGPTRRKNA